VWLERKIFIIALNRGEVGRDSRDSLGRRFGIAPLTVAEVNIVCNNFHGFPLVSFFVSPVPGLQSSGHHSHPALGEIPAHKLSRMPPSGYINEINAALTAFFVGKIPVNRKRKRDNRDSAICGFEFWVASKAAHDYDVI
jgi:hypothetical protein